MDPFHFGPAPVRRAPLRDRLGRSLERAHRRFHLDPGAQSLSARGRLMTIGLEAIVLSPYLDSARPPVLSIYVGHTRFAGAPDPAAMWHINGSIADAIRVFATDAAKYEAGVRRAFTRPLSPPQFDAAFDFNYHTGAIETANWVKLFNAGQDDAAQNSLANNWHSQPSRTEAERALFFEGKYAGDGTALLIPANARGILDWRRAQRVDIASLPPAPVRDKWPA